jgi:hypothetical protein
MRNMAPSAGYFDKSYPAPVSHSIKSTAIPNQAFLVVTLQPMLIENGCRWPQAASCIRGRPKHNSTSKPVYQAA